MSEPDSMATRALRAATRVVARAPAAVAVAACVLAVLAVIVAVKWMGFRTSRLDLLNPRSEYNQRWLAYLDEFGDEDDALILVEADERSRVTAAIDALAEQLQRPNRPFTALIYRRDLSALKSKAFHYFPSDDLRRIQTFLNQFEPVRRGDWQQFNTVAFLRELQQRLSAGTARGVPPDAAALTTLQVSLDRFAAGFEGALANEPTYRSPWAEMNQLDERLRQFDPEYLLSDDGQRGFVALRLAGGADKLAGKGPAIDQLRTVIDDVRRRFPGVSIGLTGMPVLEYDEMRTSQFDMTVASIVSLVGVLVLLVAGFGRWRYTWLCLATLMLGMAWSFGFIVISVGHLNLLSVSFAAILIGLGIDFGIHYLARYLQLRQDQLAVDEALVTTATGLGPGMITGAMTTAFAFFTAGLTEFTGVAELGVIAGGGILLCLSAALLVLPSMLMLIDRERPSGELAMTLPLDRYLQPFFSRPLITAMGVLLVTLVTVPGIFRLRYDHNLLHLQPKHLESVEVEERLLETSDRSVWFAVSMAADREALLALKAKFDAIDCVERTEEISTLIPVGDDAKTQLIVELRKQLVNLPTKPPVIPVASAAELDAELARLVQMLGALAAISPPNPNDSATSFRAVVERLANLRRLVSDPLTADFSQRLAAHQQRSAEDLLVQFQRLAAISDPAPPTLDDLPPSLAVRFFGKNGRHLLRVYARGDIWEMERLERFVRDCEAVDANITGHPIQTYYASHQMQRSYLHSAVYSLLAVLIVLVVDFRRLSASLLALAPLGLGIVQTLGVMGWLAIPFNAANMIVLPLLLGIGIDNGVHVVHDWRAQRGRFRPSNSVLVSMLLCSSTTMVGFCSMMFARHQGLRSLGQVLTLGIFLCLVTSLLFLPAILLWWTSRDAEES